MHRALIGLLLVLGFSPLPAQRVWTVDLFNRPGTDFTDLPQAYAAAAPGDVLLVRFTTLAVFGVGPFDWYTAPTIDGKGVTILGDGAGRIVMQGHLMIRNVPSNQVAALVGVELDWRTTFPPGPVPELTVENNRGTVLFDRWAYPFSGPGILSPFTLRDNDMLVLRDSNVVISPFVWWLVRTNLILEGTRMQTVGPIMTSMAGVVLQDSKLWVYRSTIIGQSAYSAQYPNAASGAVYICQHGEVFAGPGSVLQAGFTGFGSRDAVVQSYVNGICPMTQPVFVHRDPSAQFIGQYPSFNFPLIVDDPTPVAGLTVDSTSGTWTLTQGAHPGSLTLLAAGRRAAPWTSLVGPVLVDPLTLVISDLRPASATGTTVRSYALPPSARLGTLLTFQAFELLPTGELRTSNATAAGVW